MPLEYRRVNSSIRVFLVEYSTSGILVNNSGKVFWILDEFGKAMEECRTVECAVCFGSISLSRSQDVQS